MTEYIIRESDSGESLYELLADGVVVFVGDLEAVDLQSRRLVKIGDTVIEEYVKQIFPRPGKD